MIRRTQVVTAIVCIMTLLTLGTGWLAFGQKTDTPQGLSQGMGTPLVRDLNLTKRVEVLEATVLRLDNELNEIKNKSKK
ncbi:MAG: hypothetical protein A2283_14550 [Lentisphaerae bacterium RIFOXYA12_FULL_48_11]|nr:MAG: hypothetical protein A2283_14550 [Lentisphaerae bacterium RIFOXYA12_FULL_48_11]